MKSLLERLREAELALHTIWSHHCAGAECKELHKPVLIDIQQCLLEAADELEKRGDHE